MLGIAHDQKENHLLADRGHTELRRRCRRISTFLPSSFKQRAADVGWDPGDLLHTLSALLSSLRAELSSRTLLKGHSCSNTHFLTLAPGLWTGWLSFWLHAPPLSMMGAEAFQSHAEEHLQDKPISHWLILTCFPHLDELPLHLNNLAFTFSDQNPFPVGGESEKKEIRAGGNQENLSGHTYDHLSLHLETTLIAFQ